MEATQNVRMDQKIQFKKAGVCSVAIGGINILIHILVIVNLIPYMWVNGGRTASFTKAQQILTGFGELFFLYFCLLLCHLVL